MDKPNPSPFTRIFIFLVKTYQWLISPFINANCRFYPSCSSYTIQALETHGLLKGSYLSLKRIAKCHPGHPGGIDEVPPKH
ncbi:MAG: membrane protein insertion efficiency factor YidD [Pseudomonadales bacterium]|nr:membrane protein insertion efficiency factor YidD [Pseudomonadales bacterium]